MLVQVICIIDFMNQTTIKLPHFLNLGKDKELCSGAICEKDDNLTVMFENLNCNKDSEGHSAMFPDIFEV